MQKTPSALRIWLPVVIWAGFLDCRRIPPLDQRQTRRRFWKMSWSGYLDSLILLASIASTPSCEKEGISVGYGILGYFWFGAFSTTCRNSTRFLSAGLAIACTFLIASLDEWHQSFSPGRTGQFGDVVLDTSGAARACLPGRRYDWPTSPRTTSFDALSARASSFAGQASSNPPAFFILYYNQPS